MSHRRLFTLAAVFAALIIAGFALSVPHVREVPSNPAQETQSAGVPVVTLHDSYKKGVHSFSGTVTAPDACASVSAEATATGDASSTESVQISLTIPPDTGTCLMLATKIPFAVQVEAPANAPVTVSVNGVLASTTPS